MIEIKNLDFSYKKTPVFHNINLTFKPGCIYGLLGENGVGKTTLLKIISGLQEPQLGSCTVDGHVSFTREPEFLQNIVFLPDEVTVPEDETPMKYIKSLAPFYPNYAYGTFLHLMQEMEVEPEKKFREMSYGQQKKSLIACTLSLGTDYVLLDEPTNGLDIPSKADFRTLLSKRATEGTTIIISTHQVKDVENLIDPIIILTHDDVLLNSDVEVTEGWLNPLTAYLDAHPDVAAVQPKIRSWRNRNMFEHAGAAGGFLNPLGYPYCRGRILWKVEEDKGQYDTIVDVDWTSGACMCVRTNIYKECGGLDAAFFAHMEEIDLCWRMRNKGWRLVCLPDSVVYHLGGGSLNYESPRKTYLNHRNNLLMIYKNKQHPCGVLFVRFFLDYAAAAFYLLQGRWGACKAVFEARRDYRRMRG